MKTKNPISNLIVLVFIALATSMTFSSCKDECKDVDCLNGGTCSDGDCTCPDGYIGTRCETEERAKFIGNYSVSNGTVACGVSGNGTISAGTAVIVSSNSSGIRKISINIGGAFTILATISGSTLTVDNQTLSGYTYTGTGSVVGNILNLTISEADAIETCVYTIAATK